jgi:regulator of replication initiation timing
MMDITEKLRASSLIREPFGLVPMCYEAANEIDRLRLENAHLRGVLTKCVSTALHEAALAEKDAEIARLSK